MWSQTIGHNRQINRIRKALQEEKVPHAYLFSGLEGIGKKRVALGLAQGLNCLEASKAPCEKCLACIKTAKNIHPDCLLIEPEGKVIPVNSLRELKQKVYLHPLEGRAKIFLIDQAEKMTTASANALLKILEEPPAQTHFILMTSSPSLLLPTIRSRCQRIDFTPLAHEEIQKILLDAGVAKEEAPLRARLAQGSAACALGWDLSLFEGVKRDFEKLQSQPTSSSLFQLSESFCEEEEKLPFILQALHLLVHEKLMAARDPSETKRWTDRWLAVQNTRNILETYANRRLSLEALLFRLGPS